MIQFRTLGGLELCGDGGRALTSVLAHPKRFAVLLFLAIETPTGGQRRDRLLALLWPESDQEHSRGSLRKEIHFLRQSLGPGIIGSRGYDQLVLDESRIVCDVRRFRAATRATRLAEAMDLYGGEFSPGFFVPAAPEFEHWLERQRDALRREAIGAAVALSTTAEAAGAGQAAIAWAWRAHDLAGGDEIPLRRLLELLDRQGDRIAALRVFGDYQRWLASEALEPSAETLALVARIRVRTEPHSPVAICELRDTPPPSAGPRPPRAFRPSVQLGPAGPAFREDRERPAWRPQ